MNYVCVPTPNQGVVAVHNTIGASCGRGLPSRKKLGIMDPKDDRMNLVVVVSFFLKECLSTHFISIPTELHRLLDEAAKTRVDHPPKKLQNLNYMSIC